MSAWHSTPTCPHPHPHLHQHTRPRQHARPSSAHAHPPPSSTSSNSSHPPIPTSSPTPPHALLHAPAHAHTHAAAPSPFTQYPLLKFYRGFFVTMLRMVPYAGISFLSWEFLRARFVQEVGPDGRGESCFLVFSFALLSFLPSFVPLF